MKGIKAICNEIIESIDSMLDNDIALPERQKSIINNALNDALRIIEEYNKCQKHNIMVELIFDLSRKIDEYKANIPHDLEVEELDSNIQELETITDLFDQLV